MRNRGTRSRIGYVTLVVAALCLQAACARLPDPVAPDTAPSPSASPNERPAPPPPPPPRPAPAPIVPPDLPREDEFASRSLEEINRESPLAPAFFTLDVSELDELGRQAIEANAEVLRRYPNWVVTIEAS